MKADLGLWCVAHAKLLGAGLALALLLGLALGYVGATWLGFAAPPD